MSDKSLTGKAFSAPEGRPILARGFRGNCIYAASPFVSLAMILSALISSLAVTRIHTRS